MKSPIAAIFGRSLRSLGLVLLLAVGPTWAQSNQSAELTPTQLAQYQHMVNQLRCLVCQNQTIADSDAPLAQDLRDQVREQILAGRSDAEITEYVTARYGDFVLYKPPFKRSTWALWIGPFGLLLLGLGVAVGLLRRRPTAAVVPVVDPARLQEVLDAPDREGGVVRGAGTPSSRSSSTPTPNDTQE